MNIDTTRTEASRQGRIIEIVMFLVDQMQDRRDLAEVDTKSLSLKGYSETEISTAYSWLLDKAALTVIQMEANLSGKKQVSFSKSQDPFRPFHDVEQNLISREGRGMLIQMRELGLLTDADVETIIDRIWFAGGRDVSAEVIRELSAHVIFDFNDSTRSGSRMMLSAQDRVQ